MGIIYTNNFVMNIKREKIEVYASDKIKNKFSRFLIEENMPLAKIYLSPRYDLIEINLKFLDNFLLNLMNKVSKTSAIGPIEKIGYLSIYINGQLSQDGKTSINLNTYLGPINVFRDWSKIEFKADVYDKINSDNYPLLTLYSDVLRAEDRVLLGLQPKVNNNILIRFGRDGC